MNVTLKSNFGTLAHMVEFISNAKIEIGMENQGKFSGHLYAEVQISETWATNAITKMRVYSSGHKSCNSGIISRMVLPFKPTKLAREAFDVFSKQVETLLVEFVETEKLSCEKN